MAPVSSSRVSAVLGVALAVLAGAYGWQVAARAHFTAPAPTPMLYDRGGRFLAQFGTTDGPRREYGFWTLPTPPERVVRATLALEDRRFEAHPGVDLRAVARAVWQHLRGGHSGASTIAMQVARMQHPAPRTLWSKAVEAGTALVLTQLYGRQAVLEQYLRLVPYGNGSHGIGHAARWYFDKPVVDLSWAEIALLAAIPQAPALMNPLLAAARAQLDALQPSPPPARPAVALHAILRLGRMAQAMPRDPADPRLRTTLDLDVQRTVAAEANAHLDQWRSAGAQQVAVMVVRRRSRDVVAAVGSAGYDSLPAGQVDFTTALRSPGSTLKPFIYALALERGVLSPSALMEDLPEGAGGIGNADGSFLGALLPRQALANSRNVPAVTLLRRVGLDRSFDRLKALGLHDLDGPAARFGLSMAIGSLPTSLDRLMRAYETLAEDGQDADLRWFQDQAAAVPRRVVPPGVARQVTSFLSDPMARLPSFPRYGTSEFPFAVALKTGTSQGYRDAWVMAWSNAYLVGVWVGRADAGPMTRLSGARVAGELAQSILLRLHGATRGDLTAGGFPAPPGTAPVELCAETGRRATPGCRSRLLELLPVDAPDRPETVAAGLSIISPEPDTRIWRNPEVPAAANRLVLRAQAGPGVRQIVWLVDGKPFAVADPSAPVYWPAVPGTHLFQIRLPLQASLSRPVRVVVE
jgi:penicillin-binding protein 1C